MKKSSFQKLTDNQQAVILHVNEIEPCTMNDLDKHFNMNVVWSLIKNGWLERITVVNGKQVKLPSDSCVYCMEDLLRVKQHPPREV